jgi:hypothetical protein
MREISYNNRDRYRRGDYPFIGGWARHADDRVIAPMTPTFEGQVGGGRCVCVSLFLFLFLLLGSDGLVG